MGPQPLPDAAPRRDRIGSSHTTRKQYDPSKLKQTSLFQRDSLVVAADFARPGAPIPGFGAFMDELPDILGGSDFKALVEALVQAKTGRQPVGIALGAHVIKVGCSPILIDLMQRKLIKHVAMTGAGAVHDYEVSLAGKTSEDVGDQLELGEFGMAKETTEGLNKAARKGHRLGIGFGRGLGETILQQKHPHADLSIAAEAVRLKIPVTVHAALGTDIVHMHPSCDGGSVGKASMRDFHTMAEFVARIGQGVWLNIGCAVLLPEVFLKAVSMALNLGFDLSGMTTAGLDMLRPYRVMENVVRRPPGNGLFLGGQHEFLLPLLRQAWLARLEEQK